MIISTAVVARAAEDHRKEPHALEQQRGHAVPQVWCNSLFLAPQCGPGLFCFSDFYAAAVKMHVLSNQLMCCLRWSTATYSSAMMIPPFRLLQADYPSTILGIKYDNSTVIGMGTPTVPVAVAIERPVWYTHSTCSNCYRTTCMVHLQYL